MILKKMLNKCLRGLVPRGTGQTIPKVFGSSYALMIKEFGDPSKVVEKVDTENQVNEKTSVTASQVLINFKASPINPADINTIQGTYGVKPNLPVVGGGEGVATVVRVGSGVTKMRAGDHVIPTVPGYGTWRSYAIADQEELFCVDKDLDIFDAAQLSVNPPTAYRMLKDFVPLQPGDSVIQNGANSAVGLYVIQLAKEWGLKTINVVRDRSDVDAMNKLIDSLRKYGADHIITEEQLRDRDVMSKIWSSASKPKLALNCVAGTNATDCMRHIAPGGVMVTYGGMSKKPLTVPVGAHIFNDIRFHAFWMTRWRNQNKDSPALRQMMEELTSHFKNGKIKAPNVIAVSMNDYKSALEKAMKPFVEGKVIMTP